MSSSSCSPGVVSEDICLTQPQALDQLIKLLPRGRAWRTDEDAPVRRGFLNALAASWAYIEERLCALRLEFFCQSETETNDVWLRQYGLPDACDPYPDLCGKVAAFGGTQCDYFQAIAARAGWSIACLETGCGAIAGRALAGCAQAGRGRRMGELHVLVNLAESHAYTGGYRTPPLAGRLRAGQPLACPPDLSALECLLERIVHAHVLIVYSTTTVPASSMDFRSGDNSSLLAAIAA
ncbi:DUF2313 domain-containing protein [Methylocella tundrae]|uniref:Uncharacterized protein n=1 Tax=Methylocella tundrae TaxID=227605 RepID=A0A4U8YWZ7_METTU|nr:DUF2313 domain-containing protein [Methylocella tundrae]WPP05519.1 DUF2313 domain-containing protein [Methylocella tundrae]VFU07945.1 conserved protein of unknown function [Methylocella tundrae]